MKQLCIAALHHIEVDAPLERGERLASDIRLTNDRQLVAGLVTKRAEPIFGHLEIETIRMSRWWPDRIVETEESPCSACRRARRARFLHELKKFQTSLWLIRDNAASFENALLEWPHGTGNSLCHMNQWDGLCIDARGTREAVIFSREEFRRLA